MMPTSTTAPKTGRDISKRVLLALLVAFATLPASVPARAQTQVPVQPSTAGMGYYMMQGSRIVGGPFPSAPACMKALSDLVKTLPANIAPIVCAHRRP